MNHRQLHNTILEASKAVGKTWPLYAFVTSNPLSGYEGSHFENAVKQASENLGARVFPKVSVYKDAWNSGEINRDVIRTLLREQGYKRTPEESLEFLEASEAIQIIPKSSSIDKLMSKWLAAFLDEGLSEWDMPNRELGFFRAWRRLAVYDQELGFKTLNDIPESPELAIEMALSRYKEEDYLSIFTAHLAALPGWVGYINYRSEANTAWQKAYPINLTEYLAVRLWITIKQNLSIRPEPKIVHDQLSVLKIQYTWLKAWEQSWQKKLTDIVLEGSRHIEKNVDDRNAPAAQMVFCIDTRSECIRRHIEAKGPYETFGYAGFFGIAMDYENLNDGISRKSCPPILDSAYKTVEIGQPGKQTELADYKKYMDLKTFSKYFLKRMKHILPSAFGYVEGSGLFYGMSMIARTAIPGLLYKRKRKGSLEAVCEPELHKHSEPDSGIPLEDKVAIVKTAFDLMGWDQFAPVVLFVGHGAHTANNPYGSSLDCGACAASPGRHNARMLAKLANMEAVREALGHVHGIHIPEQTIFVGAEHNTTTDEVDLFDAQVPASHKKRIEKIKEDFLKAQQTATQERLGADKNSVKLAFKKANNWSETRPEWGLAKNAAFIIGPRNLTKKTPLDGRCFLHSYDWQMDKTGAALEAIMKGPMVVTQWINNQYYFASVDNEVFGGGSKIIQNITGNFGVVQGNGGDLKMGLPLESLHLSDESLYHKPLRLTVVIAAPRERVNTIILNNPDIKNLIDKEWIYLMVVDPIQNDRMELYRKNMNWSVLSEGNNAPSIKTERVIQEVEEDVLV